MPVPRYSFHDCMHTRDLRQIVDSAQRKAVPNIASRAFFCSKVVVVLWNRGLEHRRAEIRGIRQILCKRVISENGRTALVAAANIDIASVVPALCRVLEEVDTANRECGVRYI